KKLVSAYQNLRIQKKINDNKWFEESEDDILLRSKLNRPTLPSTSSTSRNNDYN
ncbi:4616_t:CDS:2, partial [Ambispora leptoticha]